MKLTLVLLFVIATIIISSVQAWPRFPPWGGGGGGGGSESSDKPSLINLQLFYRHGDRTPYWIYNTDRYRVTDYPEGEGNLVNRGRERMYRYGKYLKDRYRNYIANMPSANVTANSSPIRRCIESSLSLLAGFFPPPKHWSSELLSFAWQPIAVASQDEPHSYLLNPDVKCPRAEQIDREMDTTDPVISKALRDNAEFILKLSNFTGEDFAALRWPWVGYLYDTLFTEKVYFGSKFQQPSWYREMGPNATSILSYFNDLVFSAYAQADEFLKLRAGNFLYQLVKNFNSSAANPTYKNVQTFGSHDTMEAYILQILGVYREQPTYGSGLIFELHKLENSSEPTVHVYYANLTNNAQLEVTNKFDVYPLALNESTRLSAFCRQAHCELSQFTKGLQPFLVEDPEKLCLQPLKAKATAE